MLKGSKKKICECCGRAFMAPADKPWMTIDNKCYVKYYLPFKHRGTVASFRNKWPEIKKEIEERDRMRSARSGELLRDAYDFYR